MARWWRQHGDRNETKRERAMERMLRSVRREVTDERVLAAMASVPRQQFVTLDLLDRAYDDSALPIGEGQTISQPLMVGVMLQALDAREEDVVLDVGTGSGYQAALLSRLARRVVSVERIAALADVARSALQRGGYTNVDVFFADGPDAKGELGWPKLAPYDCIVVAAAAPSVPRSLIEQLKPGGRLVIPVGTPFEQDLARVVKRDAGVDVTWLGRCRFVPLIGEDGWPDGEGTEPRDIDAPEGL